MVLSVNFSAKKLKEVYCCSYTDQNNAAAKNKTIKIIKFLFSSIFKEVVRGILKRTCNYP